MKIEPQPDRDRTQLAECLEDCSVAMLTQADGNGALRARPMSALELDRDGNLWFLVDYDSMGQRDLWRINVSFADARGSVYISVCGHAQLSRNSERARQLWSPLARPWFPDGPESEALGLLKVIPTSAEVWDAPHSRAVRSLALAASIVSGRPLGMGTHHSVNTQPTDSRSGSGAS